MSSAKIKILYIGLKYDYGQPERGLSFEFINFLDGLYHLENVDVEVFAFDEIMRAVGMEEMNKQLITTVNRIKPDLCFFILFTDEIKKETIRHIAKSPGMVTFNWFSDDHWRFDIFSRHWAPCFHYVSTTDSGAVEKYIRSGYRNVIKTQWGFNHHKYRRYECREDYDVTFIGQTHSHRKNIIKRVKSNGIDIHCWGKGWPDGRIETDEMIKLFSRSRINLNFTESSVVFGLKSAAKIFLNRRADDSFHLNTPPATMRIARMMLMDNVPQIKARNFEIPGSGGFLMTQNADNLGEYFIPDKEIVIFSDTDDLTEKIRFYLKNGKERENIRCAGHKRAMEHHTYERRFREIFKEMGLLI